MLYYNYKGGYSMTRIIKVSMIFVLSLTLLFGRISASVVTNQGTITVEAKKTKKSARNKAIAIAVKKPYSKKQVYEYLIKMGYSKSQAKYGVKKTGISWKKQALRFAKKFEKKEKYNRGPLRDILREEKFTKKQIKYAIKHLKVNWKSIALYNAENWDYGYSKQMIIDRCKSEGCTKKEIKYVLKRISHNWNTQACEAANWYYLEIEDEYKEEITDEMIYNYLYKTLEFTKEQAEYGKTHWRAYKFEP